MPMILSLSRLTATPRVFCSRLTRLDVVSREEFDAQTAVLKRTRERLEALEAQIAALDEALSEGGSREIVRPREHEPTHSDMAAKAGRWTRQPARPEEGQSTG